MNILHVGLMLFIAFRICETHLDELHFTCRSHAGCEIFDYCSKDAFTEIRGEITELMNDRLKETQESWKQEMENVEKELEEKRAKDLQELRDETEKETEQKITNLNEKVNASISSVRKLMAQRTVNDKKKMNDLVDVKVKETVRRMTSSVRKAQGETDAAGKKVIEELKTDTQKLLNDKTAELSKRWNGALGRAKNDLTSTINKAIATINRRIKQLEDGVREIGAKCNKSIAKMNNDIEERLRNFAKENLTLNEVEKMIDAKVKQASIDWTYLDDIDDLFSDEDETGEVHNVSLTRRGPCKVSYDGKCFWVIEPELAMPYDRGVNECQRHGGEIGNIYSQTHIDLLKVYMRSLIFERRMYIDAWTGMKIDPMSGDVTYTNGSKATFFEWEPGSPALGRSFREWTGIYVVVKKDPKSEHQGIVNSSPESIRDGVLCEI